MECDIFILCSHRSPFYLLLCGSQKNRFYSSFYGDDMWLKKSGNKDVNKNFEEPHCLIKIEQLRSLQ